jgi:hypothetical protein
MPFTNSEPHPGTCVVSFDVASSLQSFRSKGLIVPNPDDPIFDRIRKSLLERVNQALGEKVAIHPVDKNELRIEIWKRVQSHISDNGQHAVLVTCSEMAELNPNDEELNLSINRLFDADGKMLGYGPRPGFDYLDRQFDELARKIAGRPVILAKEGAFRGHTCLYIIKELEKRGVKVATIVIGFCDVKAKAVIEQVFGGNILVVNTFENLIEWIADRDLIPFMPGCGRVLGEHSAHSFAPVRTPEGFSCAYPYILPFGMIEKWTSMPASHALELSTIFLGIAIELFDRIGRENGLKIAVGELLGNNPRVSIPVTIGLKEPPLTPETEVIGFLGQMLKKLE